MTSAYTKPAAPGSRRCAPVRSPRYASHRPRLPRKSQTRPPFRPPEFLMASATSKPASSPPSAAPPAAGGALRDLVREFQQTEPTIRQGGGDNAIERQHSKNRLSARERIDKLVDDPRR